MKAIKECLEFIAAAGLVMGGITVTGVLAVVGAAVVIVAAEGIFQLFGLV